MTYKNGNTGLLLGIYYHLSACTVPVLDVWGSIIFSVYCMGKFVCLNSMPYKHTIITIHARRSTMCNLGVVLQHFDSVDWRWGREEVVASGVLA